MRTVRRKVAPLNTTKKALLEKSCLAYAQEKKHWLDFFKAKKYQARLKFYRQVRDEAIKNGYQSKAGLQARQWKLALQDAAETWDKYFQALFVEAREKIARHKMTDLERHYAFWLLKGYDQFAACMKGEALEPPFALEKTARLQVAGYIERTVRGLQGNPPRVQKARSIKFDTDCYEVFEQKGNQYIKLMSLQKGKRIILPLLGNSKIQGNISLLMEGDVIEILISQEIKSKKPCNGPLEAIDFGYTEVMTDTEGLRYGKSLGSILTKATDDQNKKMKKRHKLHSLEKRLRLSDLKKASRLRKYNLGKIKQQSTISKVKASIGKEINTAIHELVRSKKPILLITEDLRSSFTLNKSKTLNRRLSSWVRGEIQDRISFKALAECFRHEQVHPAYGSQTCPNCDFVDSRNRKGDKFRCLHCGHEDVADRVAALNYARRYGDDEIRRYMPCRQVKTILQSKFLRRLEAEQSVTVPGWTLDTVQEGHPPPLIETML